MIDLIRRWAVDWLNGHDSAVCAEIMHPDYCLSIGAVELVGRNAYVEATEGQLRLFPGLVLTVHDVIVGERHAAVRFTEHGAGTHKQGRPAAWGGVALFESDGTVLTRTWAEEDYFARSRQLAGGPPDVVEPPSIAPWDQVPLPPNPQAEAVVRTWIAAGLPLSPTVHANDSWLHSGSVAEFSALELDIVFSAGRRVAFHGRQMTETGFGQGVAGLVVVGEDGHVAGRLVSDRLGARAHGRDAR